MFNDQHQNNFNAMIKSSDYFCEDTHTDEFLEKLYDYMGGESIPLDELWPCDALINVARMMEDDE